MNFLCPARNLVQGLPFKFPTVSGLALACPTAIGRHCQVEPSRHRQSGCFLAFPPPLWTWGFPGGFLEYTTVELGLLSRYCAVLLCVSLQGPVFRFLQPHPQDQGCFRISQRPGEYDESQGPQAISSPVETFSKDPPHWRI